MSVNNLSLTCNILKGRQKKLIVSMLSPGVNIHTVKSKTLKVNKGRN